MNYSENALKIYKKLYINEKLKEKTPEDVHTRVAKFIANNEEEYEQFIYLMNNKIFRPNTPTLINAGFPSKNPIDQQLMACFIFGLEDTMESIIDMWGTCSKIYASGAGVGINITNLREKDSPLSTSGKASGALSYLKVLELVSQTVMAGGKNRRAANLGVININHPDTFDLLNCKKEKDSFKSFNISLLATDYFMDNVNQNKEFGIEVISPNPISRFNKEKISIKGHKLWENIIENAWESGDPGLLFIDQANRFNPFPSYGPINSANACQEIPLPEWNACVLGAINLNKILNKKNLIDWKIFSEIIKWSVIFLNNIIDKTSYLHPKFEEHMKKTRPIGLGIMGFADILIKLKIPYDSKEAVIFFESICKKLTTETIKNSIELAKNSGSIEIPENDKERFINLLKYYTDNDNDIIRNFKKYGIKNCTWTTCQPTGSIALSAECSYSFEPLSAIVWEKELAETHEIMKFINPEFEKWLNSFVSHLDQDLQIQAKERILNKIIENNGSIQNILEIPQNIRNIFKIAHDIDPFNKIDMQSAGQKYISLGMSSTCNLPNNTTKETIEKIFIYAWEKGLKGITIYRDGSHEWQPINFGKKECKEVTGPSTPNYNVPLWEQKTKLIERPITRDGKTFEIKTTNGKLFLTLNKDNDGNPLEVFLRLGKAGHLENLLLDTIARLISKNLQAGVPYNDVSSILRDIRGDKFWFKLLEEGESIGAESIMDAVGIIMDTFFPKEIIQAPEVKIVTNVIYREQCPNCNKYTLRRDTGCKGGLCEECGFSNCG